MHAVVMSSTSNSAVVAHSDTLADPGANGEEWQLSG